MFGLNINNLHPAIQDLMLQRNDIQEQLHNIETRVEGNQRTLENWSNTERAKPISDRIINEKNYVMTKRNQLEFVHTCIAFLEFTQQQQQVLGRKEIRLRIDEELSTTATLSDCGPKILQDTVIAPRTGHSDNGNCLRILTVDLGNGEIRTYRLLIDENGADGSSTRGWRISGLEIMVFTGCTILVAALVMGALAKK